jgi:recombination protein RecT
MTDEIKRPEWEVAIYSKKIKERFLEVMSEQDYYREVILAKQIVENNDTLQKCSLSSLQAAIINIALTGATLNPALQEAFLVPRKSKVVLDFSYRGLIGIACSKGNVKSMAAQVVYEWDEFEYEQGTKPFIHYKMNLNPPEDMDEIAKSPKKIWDYVICAFSTATLLDGSVDFVILPKHKLWKIYQTSEGKDNAKMPWSTWPEEQIRKTVIKYHSKTLPKQGNERLATAVSILNEHEGLVKQPTTSDKLKERFTEPPKEENDMIECPDNQNMVMKALCDDCVNRQDCPAWES